MGAKASTIWYVDALEPVTVLRDHREPDQSAGQALAGRLYPDLSAVPDRVAPIALSAGVGSDEVYIGCYPGITVVCGAELSLPRPSTLSDTWVRPLASEFTFMVSIDPDNSWGAFAMWERGALRRSFSATTVHILEDVGLPLVWERPYWAGEHPIQHPPGIVPDPQSLPFDPQDFADEANEQWLGFRYRGEPKPGDLDPQGIVVCGFSLHQPGKEPGAAPALPPIQPANSVEPAVGPLRKWFRRRAGDGTRAR